MTRLCLAGIHQPDTLNELTIVLGMHGTTVLQLLLSMNMLWMKCDDYATLSCQVSYVTVLLGLQHHVLQILFIAPGF